MIDYPAALDMLSLCAEHIGRASGAAIAFDLNNPRVQMRARRICAELLFHTGV
jgi:hypothetical protein